jgi:hypothetical protein
MSRGKAGKTTFPFWSRISTFFPPSRKFFCSLRSFCDDVLSFLLGSWNSFSVNIFSICFSGLRTTHSDVIGAVPSDFELIDPAAIFNFQDKPGQDNLRLCMLFLENRKLLESLLVRTTITQLAGLEGGHETRSSSADFNVAVVLVANTQHMVIL